MWGFFLNFVKKVEMDIYIYICIVVMLYFFYNKLCEGIINWVLYFENLNRGILVLREMFIIKFILNFFYIVDWFLFYLIFWFDVFLIAEWSFVNRGFIFVWMTVSFFSVDVDFRRIGFWGLFSVFKKVVCSWGRNGFSWILIYKM